jgi:dipeptidyl aminopeptidase/acylaminoacyl peptidase
VKTEGPPADSGRRRISIEDLLAWKIANDPQMAPEGSRVVCTVTTVDGASHSYRTHLWIVPIDHGAPWPLTAASARDTGPRWSPDGTRIAFISDRGDSKQVWIIPVGGGEPRALTSGAFSPSDLAWSPDGQWIACVGKPGADRSSEESDVRVISRLRYKQDGEGLWDGRWKQVFVVRAEGGEIRQVTQGEHDHLAPAWSPDGTHLAYTGNASPDADLANASDVWVIPVSGTAPPRRLTCGLGPVQSPSWSPDGTHLAYVGHDNACWDATHWGIWMVSAVRGGPVCLTRGYDRSVEQHLGSDVRAQPTMGGLAWTPDGGRLYFVTADGGNTQIASVSVPDAAVRLETRGAHEVVGCTLDRAARRLACIENDPLTPGEVAVAELGDSGAHPLRRVTAWNAPLLDTLALTRPERFQCAGADGWTIEGWVMKPAVAGKGGRVPAVLKIHGGPHSAYGNAFSHEFQLLCAEGYAVIFANPRGSQGYSQTFAAATRHDWGGKDYEDLMRVLDHALATCDWIDPDRLGVAGGSYGGFMTNWIIGHTQRFRAAVTLRSTCNRISQWGTSDTAYLNGLWEFPGDPWESPAFYLERSPITYVGQMRTPLLILHGENDLRCPINQAEQLFVALKKQGTPTLFVRFPGESHGLSQTGQPRHRTEQLRHFLSWFHIYLQGSPYPLLDGRRQDRNSAANDAARTTIPLREESARD